MQERDVFSTSSFFFDSVEYSLICSIGGILWGGRQGDIIEENFPDCVRYGLFTVSSWSENTPDFLHSEQNLH